MNTLSIKDSKSTGDKSYTSRGRLFNGRSLFFITCLIISIFAALLATILCSELIFLATNGRWYRDIGLHVRKSGFSKATKDKTLLLNYNKDILHRVPEPDSALREYVEVINFPKKKDLYRILCIGGSTTRGVGIDRQQSYPSFLQQILDKESGGHFEVFNLGLHGGTTPDFIQRFYKASRDADFGWRDLSPDAVIIVPVWNDLRGDLLAESDLYFVGSIKWKDALTFIKDNLSSRLALGYYVYKALALRYEKVLSQYQKNDINFVILRLRPAKERLRHKINRIIEQWRRRGVKVYLAVFPSLIEEGWPDGLLMSYLKQNYPESVFFGHRQYPIIQDADREVINKIAKDKNIHCFDFSNLAKGMFPVTKLKLFVDAVHLGPELNYEIAQGIAEYIQNE